MRGDLDLGEVFREDSRKQYTEGIYYRKKRIISKYRIYKNRVLEKLRVREPFERLF
ncbi:hypothetical protein [Paenibacillus lentus]|uniref:hypothetical protein n=1 Tax=Paenibacillus lentus TaxID=1338368 RepID=UPI0013DDD6C8|nr:hypothetical protein [Paenibacillus lentus]